MASVQDDPLYESDEEWVPPTEEEQREMEEKRKKSDQISAELGRRMLLGWGLMGTTCPGDGCFSPLLKEPKTGKLFCVNCNMYVIPEDEFDPSKHSLAAPSDPISAGHGSIPQSVVAQEKPKEPAAVVVQPPHSSEQKSAPMTSFIPASVPKSQHTSTSTANPSTGAAASTQCTSYGRAQATGHAATSELGAQTGRSACYDAGVTTLSRMASDLNRLNVATQNPESTEETMTRLKLYEQFAKSIATMDQMLSQLRPADC